MTFSDVLNLATFSDRLLQKELLSEIGNAEEKKNNNFDVIAGIEQKVTQFENLRENGQEEGR